MLLNTSLRARRVVRQNTEKKKMSDFGAEKDFIAGPDKETSSLSSKKIPLTQGMVSAKHF